MADRDATSRRRSRSIQRSAPRPPRIRGRSRSASSIRSATLTNAERRRNFFSDFIAAITTLLRDRTAMLLILLSVVFIFTHLQDPATSLITSISKRLASIDALAFLGKWVQANSMKVIGILTFLPICLSAPKGYDAIAILFGAVLWVLFVPESSVWQYVIQAALLRSFLAVRTYEHRITMVILGACVYFLLPALTTVSSKPP